MRRVVACLLACVPVGALAQSKLMSQPYSPTRLEQYSAFCALWRTDVTFRSTIRISNQLAASPIDVTPTLYMADGTALDLPPVHVAQSGVATVDVNSALAQVPADLQAHVSTFGSAAIRYRYDWQGAAYATMSILDLTRSLEYSYPFVFPPGQGTGEQGLPAPVRAARDAANAQTYEGLWFRNTAAAGGFLALANTSESALGVSLGVSGLSQPAGRSISLSKHSTALIDLKTFFAGDSAMAGGITITQTGPPGALQLAGGLQDLTTGYSTNLPFAVAQTATGGGAVRQYASVGLMVNQQDPLLNFPTGVVFYPYAFFRNIAGASRMVHMGIYYEDGGHPKSLPLPDLTLAPGQVAILSIHDVLTGQPQVESMNLTFTYTGNHGDVIAATGSTDATGNYVFPVGPQAVAPSGPRTSVYWLASGGFDTMYTVWNPGSDAEDLLATLHYGTAGAAYKMPLHLEPYASEMIDIGEVIRTRALDQDGNTLPPDAGQGSVTIGSPAGAPEDPINVVFAGGIYNPQKATCGSTCEVCSGTTGNLVNPSSPTIADPEQEQFTFSYIWFDGSQHDVTGLSGWSTDNTSVLTVQTQGQTPGLGSGVGPGQAHVMPVYPPEPVEPPAFILAVNAGQICTPPPNPACPGAPQIIGSGTATVQSPNGAGYVKQISAGPLTQAQCAQLGAPAGSAGYQRWVTLQLQDSAGNPIQIAGIAVADHLTAPVPNALGLPATGTTGSTNTNASGQWPDQFYTCSTACPASNGTVNVSQSWTANGKPMANVNSIVYSCSSITINGN